MSILNRKTRVRLIPHFILICTLLFNSDLVPVQAEVVTLAGTIQWNQLPPLPDREGFAGMFAGVVSGRLVVAGGANFPNGYPWEGGKKYWYDSIYVLDAKTSPAWKKLNLKLPKPLAYGVSWSDQNRLICAGGETGPSIGDQTDRPPECLAEVFAIELIDDTFQIKPLPSLPVPSKDACGVKLGNRLIFFGGLNSNQATRASSSMITLDLSEKTPHWLETSSFPAAPRVQAVAAEHDGRLLIFSGIEITADATSKPIRKMPYLKDAWEYRPGPDFSGGDWKRLADLPAERAAGPGPAWSVSRQFVAITGGADSERHKQPQKDHAGWSHDLLLYDSELDRWTTVSNVIASNATVVTAPSVRWGEDYVILSGEIAPGRRTPAVWKWTISKKPGTK